MNIKRIEPVPLVGMGATINHYSDRTATTIVAITHKGKRLVLQENKATRIDKRGISDAQDYEYQDDPEGALYFATLRKDGRFRVTGSKSLVSLDIRAKHHDFYF